MKIDVRFLRTLFPATPEARLAEVVGPLNRTFELFDISTPTRKAAFLASVGYESGGFVSMVENLNYSWEGLRKTFGKYFTTDDLAKSYARQPQKIANRVYANRMLNGPETSGDGWKFRGRGFIQLTGKENYTKFGKEFGMKPDEVVAYLETVEGAMMSAGWFWGSKNLNQYADQDRFTMVTQRVNGGQHGAEKRQSIYDLAKRLLSAG